MKKAAEAAYDLPHKVEIIQHTYAIKNWIAPHLSDIQHHSRLHAFKFEMTDKEEVCMWYKNWSSKGNWKGPLSLLSSVAEGSPPLLWATCIQQNILEEIKRGANSCEDRQTIGEINCGVNFVAEEEEKRRFWENITEKQLRDIGDLGWYLKSLGHYKEPILTDTDNEEPPDVALQKRAKERMIMKQQTFKDVSFHVLFLILSVLLFVKRR